MRTPYRGVILASSSLFARPSSTFLTITPSAALYRSTSHSSSTTTLVTATARMSTSTDTSPSAPSPATKKYVRIVSYNLLSSKLASPSHFTHTHPDHLQADYRLSLILSKLENEMERGFGDNGTSPPPPTIFALQEVCYPFASSLHTFFASRGYHFVTGLYGRPFNGYMGVGIAYPLKDFETLNVDICRLSDTRPGGWPREEENAPVGDDVDSNQGLGLGNAIQSFVTTLIQSITNRVTMKRLGVSSSSVEDKKPIDPWDMSENRFNVLLTAVLRHRSEEVGCINSNSAFSISNYHMPCAYFAPAVMNIHTEMVAKRTQDLAAESWMSMQKSGSVGAEHSNDEALSHQQEQQQNDDDAEERQPKQTIPYILAGDFNILPNSAQYTILTKGILDSSDPTFPPPKFGMEWKVESLPMNSAYATFETDEPEFTNYAHLKDDPDPFIGTLDYIFLSKNDSGAQNEVATEGVAAGRGHEWKVHWVHKLPSKESSGGPFPSEKEPSDHLLIAADLELVTV